MMEEQDQPRALSIGSTAGFQVISMNDLNPRVREYKRRKLHKKTKSGCLSCKTKRVKCDESRPVCARCRRNGRTCAYDWSNDHEKALEDWKSENGLVKSNFSVLSAVTMVPFYAPSAKNGTPSITLLQHFQRHWTEIFNIPRNYEMISLSKSSSLIRNILLALTACHLRYVSPGNIQHRIAEHFQQSLALQDYQRALEKPREHIGQSGADILLLSGVLLNILVFILPESEAVSDERDPEPSTSWVLSTHENRLSWLALQLGFKPLLISLMPHLDDTLQFLGQIFMGNKLEALAFRTMDRSLKGVPENWIKIFELDDDDHDHGHDTGSSTDAVGSPNGNIMLPVCAKSGDVYRSPALILIKLRNLQPTSENVFRNLQFLGKAQREFQDLLYNRDERALWLFGYWFGLLCRYRAMWWYEKRVRRDYNAVFMWLEQLYLRDRPGIEGKIWTEMMTELEFAPYHLKGT